MTYIIYIYIEIGRRSNRGILICYLHSMITILAGSLHTIRCVQCLLRRLISEAFALATPVIVPPLNTSYD